jgi:hypothetical protein
MVLGELLTGQFEWGPSSLSRGSSLGRLATDSRFLTASLYSSRVRSTGPGGSLPFLREKLCSSRSQDSNVGQGVLGARVPGYWPLAGPSLFAPHSMGAQSGRRTLRWASL